MRASRSDREQVVELLKAAFMEDRLTIEELDARVGQALASQTYADLAVVTADIPAGPIATQPPCAPSRALSRPPMSTAAKAGVSVAVAVAVPAVLSLALGPFAFLIFMPFYFMALLVAGAQMLFTRYEKRSSGQLPPRPGRGEVSRGGPRPDPADDGPALPVARPDQTQADLRTHRSRPVRSHLYGQGALVPRGIRPIQVVG